MKSIIFIIGCGKKLVLNLGNRYSRNKTTLTSFAVSLICNRDTQFMLQFKTNHIKQDLICCWDFYNGVEKNSKAV